MTDRLDPATLSDPFDQAAYWHERMGSETVTPAERAAFEQWHQADPAHAACYQQVQGIWHMVAAMPSSEVSKVDPRRPRQVPARPSRRAFWHLGLGAAGAAALMLVAVDPLHWRVTPDYQARFATAHGERREITLPDKSTLWLNTDTVVSVELDAARRTVRLAQGEVFFQVDGKQGTPFLVEMASGTVRVTGTQFNVRHIDEGFSVDVLQGSVKVSTGSWWRQKTALLQAGDVARVAQAGHLVSGPGKDIQSAVAWREGKVVFRGTPLATAIQELNRYSPQRMVVRDPLAAGLRVSGIFSIDDPASFLAALPHVVPVTVQPRPDGSVVDIHAR